MFRLSLPVLVAVCAFAGSAFSQTPPSTSSAGSAPVRVQYDQVREFLPAGTPLPAPDGFEQAYVQAKSTIPPPPPSAADAMATARGQMAALEAMQVKKRFADMARGQAMSLLGGALGSIPNPLVRMLAGRVVSGAEAKIEAEARLKEQQALEQRENEIATANAQKAALQALRAGEPTLQRISIWGDWVRIDNPHDHSAIVYKPDLGKYIVIDEAHKLYRIVAAPPSTPEPLPEVCDQEGAVAALGASTLDGMPVHGYRATTTLSMDDMQMTHVQTLYFWDQPLPQRVLEIVTADATCPADSPVGRRYPQNRLAVYVATGPAKVSESDAGDDNSDLAAMPGNAGVESVQWRGHVRTLGDADRALFEPPGGYRQVQ
jgi:hypothetical protein